MLRIDHLITSLLVNNYIEVIKIKTLIVYNENGNVVVTKSVTTDNFNLLISEDVPDGREVEQVIDGMVVLKDTEEMEKIKKRMKELEDILKSLKLDLLKEEMRN